jgi:MATE family multidrug resistance protein
MAAHSIVQTTTYSAYMLPYGLTGVAAVRVGTYLGAGDAKGAKRSALSSMIFISGVMLINAVGLLALRKQITSWYMDDEGVGSEKLTQAEEFEKVSHINEILFGIASVFQVFDGAQNCGQAILRGAGKVKMGALLTLMSYYFICLPIGIPLAFYGPTIDPIVSEKGSGVVGLWIGIGVATIFLGITMTWYVLRINWDTESRLASERIRLESPIEETAADLLEQTTDSEDQIELEVLN